MGNLTQLVLAFLAGGVVFYLNSETIDRVLGLNKPESEPESESEPELEPEFEKTWPRLRLVKKDTNV